MSFKDMKRQNGKCHNYKHLLILQEKHCSATVTQDHWAPVVMIICKLKMKNIPPYVKEYQSAIWWQ